MTSGQRTSIEVVLDCLRILQMLDEGNIALYPQQDKAIRKLVEENLDELIRPLYPKPLIAAESSAKPSEA